MMKKPQLQNTLRGRAEIDEFFNQLGCPDEVTDLATALQQSKNPACDIPVDKLHPFFAQPLARFKDEDLEDLDASVRSVGYLEDAIARPHPELLNAFQLISGHGRWQLAKRRGDTTLRCKVFEVNDEVALEIFITCNFKRKDPTELQEVDMILSYLSIKLNCSIDNVVSLIHYASDVKHSKTPNNVVRNEQIKVLKSVFARVSKVSLETFRVHRLRWLNMPEDVLMAVRQGKLGDSHAKVVSKIKDDAQRQTLLQDAITQQMTVREITDRVKALSQTPRPNLTALPSRMKRAYQQIKKAKVWDDPKKCKQLEKLLSQLEALTSD